MKSIIENTCLSKKFLKLFIIVVVLFTVLNSPLFVSRANASINNEINFQGKLVNSNGTNVTDSTYTVVFSLYNVASGGTAIWTETDSVTTTSGIFQVALGANTALPGDVDFNNSSLYLGIKVGTDSEMTPRIRFSAVPYAFNAAALDDVVATESATGFNLQGGTSSLSTLSFTTSGGALTFQPGVAEGLTIDSNGANGLTLDTGGAAAIDIGNNNATSVVFGKSSNNPSFTFNNGSGGFTANGTGSITFSALNSADGLVYTSGTNGILSQTAPTGGSQCLQSNSSNNALAWTACSGLGTNYFQMPNSGAITPFSTTADFLLGGTATTSARFAFINDVGAGTPTASISANTDSAATYLTGTGILSTTNNQSLTLGSATTGNVMINPGGGTAELTAYANGTVGIGTTTSALATFDVRGISGTTSIASISGKTSFAGLVVNNSGSGDLITASSGGATKFTIKNNGSVVFSGDDSTISASGSGAVNNGSGAVENDLGDEGSLVPNAGFEANSLGGFADGWVANATNSAAVTRDTTNVAFGNASARVTVTNSSEAFYSACIPLAGTGGQYTLNWYEKLTAPLATVRGYIDMYTTEANCNQNNTPNTSTAIVPGSSPTTFTTVGTSTTAVAGLSATGTWGRVHFFVGCTTNCTNSITNIDGVRLIESTTGQGLDYAEDYPADPNNIPQPGQVVSLEASGSAAVVAPSDQSMDQTAIGVVSTNPGQVLDDGSMTNPVPIALAGRVPVNVSTANGPIQVGDYLTSSTTPGVAVKATEAGQVIGTAMEEDTDPNTSDVTQVTMFIKNTYYNGESSSSDSGLSLLSSTQDPSVLLSILQDTTTASSSALTSLTSGQITAGLNYLISAMSTNSGQEQRIASSSAVLSNEGLNSEDLATVSGLSVNGSATVSADLRVQGNGLVEGILHIVDTLFANDFIANGVSDFFGNVIFHSGVTFNNTPVFDSDTAGFALIKKGSDHVDVTFTNPYDQTPIINASITFDASESASTNSSASSEQDQESGENTVLKSHVYYIIMDRTKNGFTILLAQPAQEDISFSWVALAVNSPMIFQSDGQNILLPTQSEDISPSPIDTIIPTDIPVSPITTPTGEDFPTPTPMSGVNGTLSVPTPG